MAGELVGTFVGNLTRDPEAGQSDGGTAYARFGVAHTPRLKRGNDWVDGETMFIDVSVFGRTVNSVMQSLKQGSRVLIHGRISASTWTDQQGANKTSWKCVPDYLGPEITFDPARHLPREGGQAPQARQGGQQPAPQPSGQQGGWTGPPQPGGQQPATQGPPPGEQAPWDQPGQGAGPVVTEPFETEVPQERVDAVWDDAVATRDTSRFPAMTYEDGVIATLDWLAGVSSDPMSE